MTPMALKLAFSALVVLAALEDAWRLRISNWLSIALLILFVVAAYFSPRPIDWVDHLVAAALTFAVGAVLFARGWFGGGDVKLLTVVALWCGLRDLPLLIVFTTIAGGLLAIGLFILRRVLPAPGEARTRHHLFRRKGPIPYGIAICVGALLMAGRLPMTEPLPLEITLPMPVALGLTPQR